MSTCLESSCWYKCLVTFVLLFNWYSLNRCQSIGLLKTVQLLSFFCQQSHGTVHRCLGDRNWLATCMSGVIAYTATQQILKMWSHACSSCQATSGMTSKLVQSLMHKMLLGWLVNVVIWWSVRNDLNSGTLVVWLLLVSTTVFTHRLFAFGMG